MKTNNAQLTEKYTILSLLPYSENSQLISKQQKLSDLHITKSVVDFAIDALETFLEGDLAAFDAQVGENLCQIRAYKILHLAKKWLHDPNIKKEFQIQLNQFKDQQLQLNATIMDWEQAVQYAKSYNKNLDGVENTTLFFERHQLVFELNEDFVFLILCRFLTHFNIKNNNIPVAINLGQIATEFSVSKYRAKRFSHLYQQIVCKMGCDFIMHIANNLIIKSVYRKFLPSLLRIADEDRAVLPCFIVSDIIFKHAIQERIPVLFLVTRLKDNNPQPYDVIYFLLQANDSSVGFSLAPCNAHLSKHCLIVTGEVYDISVEAIESSEDYINRVLLETPFKLILANTAIHPQYSGKRLGVFRDNPFHTILSNDKKPERDLMAMKHYALNGGCSKQNPSTFFLKHIYANILINEINKLKLMYTGCAYFAAQLKSEKLSTYRTYL